MPGRDLFAQEEQTKGRNLFADQSAAATDAGPMGMRLPAGAIDAVKSFGKTQLRSAADLSEGALSVLNLPQDLGIGIYNAVTGKNMPTATQSIAQKVGAYLPPDTSPTGQVVTAVRKGIGGALPTLGAGGAMAALPGMAGRVGTSLAANPVQQLTAAATGSASGDIAKQMGAPGYGQILASIVGGGAGALGAGMLDRTALPMTQRQRVLEASQSEGYAVPPASAVPGGVGSVLEGAGGKLKTQQLASANNQEVTQRLATQALGLPEGTPLTPDLLQGMRQQAGNSYRVIRGVGNINTDQKFFTDLTDAAKPFKNTASAFPGLVKSDVEDVAKTLSQSSFDADAAVDAIQHVRDKASQAFRNGSSNEGSAYKQMANALEGVIERDLQRNGSPAAAGILKDFRDARQLVAKTHTVEDALSGSSVDANALGRMLKNKAPLSGELKKIGQFAQEFGKANSVNAAKESMPAYSPLDWWTALGSIGAAGAAQNPLLAIPAAYSISRPAVRSFMLSPAGQSLLTRPTQGNYQMPYSALPGVFGVDPVEQQQ